MTDSAARKAYFKEGERITREYYLADPSNPYRQSGKTGGAEHWEVTRRCIAEAVNADGDYLDLGCANGLLLESLVGWCSERGYTITPHGVDFIPELVELARQRLPAYADNFHVANAYYWVPPRRYRFVQLLLGTTVPPADQRDFLTQGSERNGGVAGPADRWRCTGWGTRRRRRWRWRPWSSLGLRLWGLRLVYRLR